MRQRCDTKQGGWDCTICKQNFRTRRDLAAHRKEHITEKSKFVGNHYYECSCNFCERKFTSKESKTVHERYCKNNPNRDIKRSQELSELQKQAQSKPDVRKKHSDAIYFSKNKVEYKGLLLDSLWEKKFLERCDELQIKYEKCKNPLIWVDANGNKKNYYPDFYLKDFDIIVEIKSPFVEKCQNKNGKIDYIKNHYPNIIWLNSLEEIEKFSLKN